MDPFVKETLREVYYKQLNQDAKYLLTILNSQDEFNYRDLEAVENCIIDDDEVRVFTAMVLVLRELMEITKQYNIECE